MTKDELELEQIRSTIANLNAETAKLAREAQKMSFETRWPPVVIAALIVAVLGPALATLVALLVS